MKNSGSAVIGVAQRDGRILMSRCRGRIAHAVLTNEYDDSFKATMLVALGDLDHIGATPRQCRPSPTGGEAYLVDPIGFERSGARQFYLFEHGVWTHWRCEMVEGLTFTIATE